MREKLPEFNVRNHPHAKSKCYDLNQSHVLNLSRYLWCHKLSLHKHIYLSKAVMKGEATDLSVRMTCNIMLFLRDKT